MASTTSNNARVLYLALDACDAETMQELIADGRCPTLEGLLSEAATAETVAPYGTFVGSIWMTMTTAWGVDRHRYYNWVELDRDSFAYRETSPREARGRPFWTQLSERGQRVAVVDIPHSQVPDHHNGILVKEWGCHDRHHGPGSFPAELLEDLGAHPYGSSPPPHGQDQFAPCDYTERAGALRTLDEERRLLDLIFAGVEAKTAACERLLAQGDWDAFIAVIGESHCVGHQLWHVHDVHHPRHDPATRAVLGDPVVRVYEQLDAAVGRIVHAAGPEALCFVHLSHGMQAHYDGDHLLDEVLHRIEQSDERGTVAGWRSGIAAQAFDRAPGRLEQPLRRAVAGALRRRIDRSPPAAITPLPPDPSRRWYQVPNNTVLGGVRLNLRGRDPHGRVDPSEVDALVAELTARLTEVINIDTGEPFVTAVVRAEEVLARTDDDDFPDLFLEWDRRAPVERVWSPRIGTVVVPYTHWRTGDHHDRGLLLARGAGITKGRRPAMTIADLAPTLADALGVELTDVDGSPRRDLLGSPGAAQPEVLPPATRASRDGRSTRRRRDPSPALGGRALELAADAARRSDVAEATVPRVDDLEEVVHDLRARTLELEQANRVWTTMRWLEGIDVAEDRLVSVITPTFERPQALVEAISSVQAQSYGRWEMLVIDDGGDDAKAVVAEVGDDRVRAEWVSHRGACGARNAGLDLAQGAVITYLDDDNLFDPGWLKAVVWGFQQRPDAEVLYGARLLDGVGSSTPVGGEPGLPWLQFNPFDRAYLVQANMADMGVIAHRAGLRAARFDENLGEYGDWDFLLALTEHRTPLELPAVALRYFSHGEDRLTGSRTTDVASIRDKWRPKRPPAG